MWRLVLVLALSQELCAKWWRLESGPFTVYTDASERAGREVMARLDLARRVFGGLRPTGPVLPLPVIVYALADPARFRALRPSEATRGFYQSAAERDHIVIEWGTAEAARVILHEYVHLVLGHSSGPLPQWLEEGLAEFHSTVEASADRVRLGKPLREHLFLLATAPWLTGEVLAGVRKDSPFYTEGQRATVFYAQSWAMVHMLRLAEGYRSGFQPFLAALESGESQPAAFQRAFGKSFSEAVSDLKTYVERASLPVVEYKAELAASGEVRVVSTTDIDGELAYAELALACGKPAEAEKLYRKLARSKQKTARVETALGVLALGARRHEEAKAHFEAAMAQPEAGAEVFFEYAMLLRDTKGPQGEVQRYLERTVQLNPNFAEAHFLLGVWAATAEKHAEAVNHLQQAATLFPRQSPFQHALALSYHALGKAEAAQQAARRAFESAATLEQAEMARAAMRLTTTPQSRVAARPEVTTPDSWRPKGDTRMEGVLQRIDCIGQAARFHVRSGGKLVALWVENPGEVLLKNASSMTFEFRCGEQKPVPVVVEYTAKSNEEQMTAGVIVGIEFR